jgi:asparagine synthase (glutamine-hydrolysing)
LPNSVIYRKKKGFPVPIDRWFRNELNGSIRDELLDDSGIVKKFFNQEYLRKMIGKQKTKNYSLQLWAILNFKLWYEEFINK